MIARPSAPVRSVNSGEFSPDAAGRIDIKQYYSAGLACKNIEPVPQGGFRLMGGTWRRGVWRRPLIARAISDAAAAATVAAGDSVVWTGTIAGTVAAVLVTGFDADNVTIYVEALAAGTWAPIGSGIPVALAAVTRLLALAPGMQVTATALRIRATNPGTPVPLAIGAVAAFYEDGTALAPRFTALTTDGGNVVTAWASAGIVDFRSADAYCGAAYVPQLTAAMLPDLAFYAEAKTIGLFHADLKTKRLRLQAERLHDWAVDDWPYAPVPKADLGGTYPKTPDKWELFVRATDNPNIYLAVTVEKETTPAVALKHAGTAVGFGDASDADWSDFAAEVQAAIVALPSIGAGVTVAYDNPSGSGVRLTLTFGSALAGDEFQVSAQIVNTTDASVLPYHTQVGKTDFEALFSASRGWPGAATLVQDRFSYARLPAASGAMALSKVGEYFDLNVAGQADNAARLDKLRSQTNETILTVKESRYVLVLTDRGVYFINNREITRNQPLNFVLASEVAAQANCQPFELEGLVYYVARDENGPAGGHQLLSLEYDDVSTSYNATPASLMASHLVQKIIRSVRQKKTDQLDASRGWLARADGRLIVAQMIRNQEILGFAEWIAAAAGLVREIGVDGKNRLWMAVERGDACTVEIYDPAALLQDTVTATPDLVGVVSGLPFADGAVLWAIADGFTIGPLVAAGGSVDLGDAFTTATIGRWQAPRWESMPQMLVTGSDDVIMRPGRIHTANLNLIDTTSIAVGANGAAPVDIPLLETGDPVDAPMPGKTKLLTITGENLPGFKTGTTLVVTQTKPGRLRVRDLSMGAKL